MLRDVFDRASFGLRITRNIQKVFELTCGHAVALRLDLITAAEDAAANTELLEADRHSARIVSGGKMKSSRSFSVENAA